MEIAAIIISIVALVFSVLAWKKSNAKSNLFLVKDGKDYIIKDNKDQEILTITKL